VWLLSAVLVLVAAVGARDALHGAPRSAYQVGIELLVAFLIAPAFVTTPLSSPATSAHVHPIAVGGEEGERGRWQRLSPYRRRGEKKGKPKARNQPCNHTLVDSDRRN
jgi:hypothetical protein